jgi:predicted alpha/beta hydrolase
VRDFYVRQLWDWKGSADPERILAASFDIYARMCGEVLARAHARSGDRVAIASYLGRSDSFDRAIGRFSVAYADQNERDYSTFVDAVRTGRLAAMRDL